MVLLLILQLFLPTISATPTSKFQINSQIPPLAIAASQYTFRFARTTFSSSDHTDIAYSLRDQPDWLQIDSGSRTIGGSPTLDDVGSVAFWVVATDATGSASMQMTLVVSSDNKVRSPDSITDQLEKYGVLASEDGLTYRTTEPFTITFRPDTFLGVESLAYFATSRDRTPLPSWIHFDPSTLTFSGASPPLIDIPQTFGVSLLASTIPGYASGVVSFDLVINDHQLAFVPFKITAAFTDNTLDLKPILRNNLLLDGQAISDAMLIETHVQLPAGLTYDPSTLLISESSPTAGSGRRIQIFATDAYGDTAQAVIQIGNGPTLFRSQLVSIKAVIGRPFRYQLPDTLFTDAVTSSSIDFGTASQWLRYEASSGSIQGKIPAKISPTIIMATITATSATKTATEDFGIRLVRGAKRSAPGKTTSLPAPHFADATAPPSNPPSEAHKLAGLSAGKIAGITIVVVIVVAILLAVLFIYCQRRRKRRRETDLKSRIVVQKLPDDSVDDLSDFGAPPSEQQKDLVEPLPLPSGMTDYPKRPDRSPRNTRYAFGDTAPGFSRASAWAAADGSRAYASGHGPRDDSSRDWSFGNNITQTVPTARPGTRYSNASSLSDRLHTDRVSVGLGHGRPSIHSPPPGLTGQGPGLFSKRLNRMSAGKGSLSSRQLFSFGPEQRQRQRQGGPQPSSIRLIESRDEADFSTKYDNYIRKRASSKRKSNPLFAGYSTRISSHQSSFRNQSSSLRPRTRTRGSRSRSPTIGADRSSGLLERIRNGSSPDRSDRSNDWEDVTETDFSGSNYEELARDERDAAYDDRSEPGGAADRGGTKTLHNSDSRSASNASFDGKPVDAGLREASIAGAPDSTRSREKAFL